MESSSSIRWTKLQGNVNSWLVHHVKTFNPPVYLLLKSMAMLNLIEFVYSKQTQGEGDSLTKNLVHNKNYLLLSGMDFSFR